MAKYIYAAGLSLVMATTVAHAQAQDQALAATTAVPEKCAAFAGARAGDWGFGRKELHITGVSPTCEVQYTYGLNSSARPQKATIIDGELVVPCGSKGGRCAYTVHSEDLWARYEGPDGGNNTVFRPIR